MNQKIILEAPVKKLFVKYVSQSIFSMIGLSFYILVDTFFIANGVGNDGLTALNLVLPLFSFVNATGLMFGMGTATRFSVLKGEGNEKKGNKVFSELMIVALMVAIIYTIIGVGFTKQFVILLGAKGNIIPLGVEYIRTLLAFSIPFVMNQFFICLVRNDENPKLAMIAMLSGSFVNVILDYIFIYPCGMGMFGAAFASGLSPVISMVILTTHKRKKLNHFHLIKTKIVIKEVIRVIGLGMSSFVTEFSIGIIMLIFNFTILKRAGNTGVAAYGIIANVSLVCSAVFTGIGQGIQPIVSMNYGAMQRERGKEAFKRGCILAVILGAIFYIVGVVAKVPITELFNKDGNGELERIALNGIMIYFIAYPLMGINILTAAYAAATEKPRESLIISISRGCIAVIVMILILPNIFGMNGVWLSIPAAELITLILVIIIKRVKGSHKEKECSNA